MAESPQTEAPEVDLHELTDALAGRLREASRQATEWKENLGRQLAAAVSQAKAEQKQPAASDPAETEKPQETALRDPRPERTPPADETPSPDRDLPVKADETPPAAEQDAPEQNDAPGITSAEPLKPVVPQYPPACIRRGLEGLVVVEAQVGVGGKVTAARVVQPSGHRRLDRAAVRAVTEARFRPATRGGEPIASRVRVPVRFRLRRR
ncbi:MAG: TonB family protein, partial [Phycisphaerae bacterium]